MVRRKASTLERLPAYAPELNPGEGLWPQLKGVELRNVCCFHLPQLRRELREAVNRVRRQPSLSGSAIHVMLELSPDYNGK